jgi:large subunit ribosomal protein L20
MHSLQYAYRDRRQLKSDYRKLWIKRINAACHQCDINYSQLVHGLRAADISINRKMLSELAINDFASFKSLVDTAKKALEK